ncbi:ATP-dependent zinc metalloprotease YME1L isoform X2 [Belonocnema kinseyi]|nr:ATP-dependent zinc metalloprotease YME1L isoform X2 [Belonocnema kinseyi]
MTKRTRKRNKWNVSYISGASFAENKKGFPPQIADSMTIFSIKPVHGILRNPNIQNFQIRGFKSQRSIKSDLESNSTLGAKIMKWFGAFPGQQDKGGALNLSRDHEFQALKSVMKRGEATPDDRVKLAFAEGYLEGHSRKSPERFLSWIRALQSIISFSLFLFIIMIIAYKLRSNDGNMFRFQFGDHLEVDAEMVRVTFSDVKGIDEAKGELQSVVDYLKNPGKFTALGGKLPKGVLLSGPPGTGKTLLARAVAGEAGVPFFHAAGPEFDEVLVGQGAKRVRDLFKAAKERAPCVIFLDEIDSVGSRRTNSVLHPYANQTINQLLSEMDGFHQNEGVIVLGATNRPKQLDPALLRPGRFDVQIDINRPDFMGRKDIFNLYLTKIIHRDLDVEKLSKATIGFTGADISNMVNQAALRAALVGADRVTMTHMDYAKQKIIMGPGRKRAMDEEINRIVAYHESGHALVAFHTKNAHNLYKVTILPAGQSLGHTSLLPKKDMDSYTKTELLANMDVCMGGRAAEELIFGSDKVSLGAFGDFTAANKIAEDMVTKFGMSEKFGFRVLSNGNKSNKLIESEVRNLLQESYDRAKTILKEHPKELKMLAEALLKYETLEFEDVKNLLSGKKMKVESAPAPRKITDITEDVPVDAPKNVL